MAQFYFLSVLMNILAGLILVYGLDLTSSTAHIASVEDSFSEVGVEEPDPDETSPKKKRLSVTSDFSGFNGRGFRLVVGIVAAFTGIIKLFSVYKGDVPVVGDIIPALAGIAGGASLLVEYFASSTEQAFSLPSFLDTLLIKSRRYIGVLCLVAAVLHFIFPKVLFL